MRTLLKTLLPLVLLTSAVAAQNPTPTAIPNGLPEWAYNIPDKVQPPEAKVPNVVRVAGSSKELEASAIAGNANPPDWFPDEHPAPPRSVKGPMPNACGSCHLMSGQGHPESADIRIVVKLASASLGDATQDEMLQGGEFLAAAANPTATWRSTSVRKTGPNRYSASGTLSLKGASKPQSLTFRLTGDGLKRHVEGSASIDRNAFGIGSGESAAGLASSVSLTFSFDATGRAP